jgi:Mor family transcriptional regulator
MDELWKELTIEMLPDNQWRQVAEAIGIENFCKMLAIVGGATTYIPQLDGLLRPVRDARIKSEFNGWNYLELARKYNITDRLVRSICGPGNTEGQMDLFSEQDGIS